MDVNAGQLSLTDVQIEPEKSKWITLNYKIGKFMYELIHTQVHMCIRKNITQNEPIGSTHEG